MSNIAHKDEFIEIPSEAITVLTLNVEPLTMTEEQFYELCRANRELRLERSPRGALIIMAPAGSETGARNASIVGQLWLWNEQNHLGVIFDSSTGFRLPNGANRSPDAAWIAQARWDALLPAQKRRFAPICPDFVIELRSPTDDLKPIQEKMHEYIANGAGLGWLLDPIARRVEIYQPDEEVETLINPKTLSGEPILPNFHLDVSRVFKQY